MAKQKRRGGYAPFSLTSGSTIVFAFLAVIIGASVLLANGIFPTKQLTDPGSTGELEIIEEPVFGGQRGLQLRTIRFRECANKAAVGLLVDRSGSMGGAKINDLKTALNTFTNTLGDESVVGLVSFSSNDVGATAVKEDVAFSRLSTSKNQLTQAIQGLNPLGSTNTRTAFEFMKDRILSATSQFPDQNFVLIFMSDGIPESTQRTCTVNPACGNRCFETTQDPTVNPNIAEEIKNAGIRVYSIALLDANDACFTNDLRNMMQNIASPNSYYETPNSSDLAAIYQEIASRFCEEI